MLKVAADWPGWFTGDDLDAMKAAIDYVQYEGSFDMFILASQIVKSIPPSQISKESLPHVLCQLEHVLQEFQASDDFDLTRDDGLFSSAEQAIGNIRTKSSI